MTRKNPLLFFSIIHIAIFMGLFVLLSQLFYPAPSDLERDFGLKVLSGMIPYRDFASEYPPLGLVAFTIPALFFKEHLSYAFGLAGEMLVFDIAALFLLRSLAPRLNLSVRGVLGTYTLFILAVGPLVVVRYDLLPGVLMLIAVWAFTNSRKATSWLASGLGIVAKISPVVTLPIFAIREIRRRKYGELVKGIAICAGVILAISLPWLLIDKNGFLSMLTYHTQRGIQWESTYASVLLVGQALGFIQVQGELTYGSWNVVAPPLSDSLAHASMYIMITLLVALYIKFARDLRQNRLEDDAPIITRFCTLAIMIFLLTNKVLSPQYLIWLYPLLALLGSGQGKWIPALFIMAGVITQILYPYAYNALELAEPYTVAMLAIRNALLVAIAVLLVRPIHFPFPGITSHAAQADARR